MSYDNLSSYSQNVLKFFQQLTGEERRIPFIFDDFHFCRSRVIGLDMSENRIFTLSFLVGTITNVLVMEIGWTDEGSGGYILVNVAHCNTSWFFVFNPTFSNISAISWQPVLVVEEAGVPGENHRSGTSNW